MIYQQLMLDSNGWPQTARNRTLNILKNSNAIHVCGDQHLGSVVQYGVDEHGDSLYAFCTPAIANTWPRRWMPNDLPISGKHIDGFGNKSHSSCSFKSKINREGTLVRSTIVHLDGDFLNVIRLQIQLKSIHGLVGQNRTRQIVTNTMDGRLLFRILGKIN